MRAASAIATSPMQPTTTITAGNSQDALGVVADLPTPG
jgi:hypothetical protein